MCVLSHKPSTSPKLADDSLPQLLLDLLDPSSCPAIQSSTLLTLVTALLDTPTNTRTFERLDGLLTVTSLFKSRGTSRDVKLKLVEFLYFYLMPEAPYSGVGSKSSSGSQRSPSKRAGALAGRSGSGAGAGREVEAKSTEEKQGLLGRYLPNVEDLVEDLRESAPFGASFA